MLRWPIRVKLIVGLSMVVGMMLILMGASIFGLHSFHLSCLTLVDQLPELGASGDLMKLAARLHAPRVNSAEEIDELKSQVLVAQQALEVYVKKLKKNSFQGSRVDSGTEELGLAFLIDDDLANILSELDPASGPPRRVLPGTKYYIDEHPELLPPFKRVTGLPERIDRLNDAVMQIPKRLYDDFWSVLKMLQLQYETARVIVWTSSLMVLAMLYGLMVLFRRWVLSPLQLLKRGVRDVAMGSFDYKLDLRSGDEMQDLAEAFNDMTAKISLTYADLERQVQERSRQLVRSERLAGVGFLAAGVAHEINNPLASIAFCARRSTADSRGS